MSALRRRILTAAMAAVLGLSLVACSGSGGKKAEEQSTSGAAGKANTPRMKFALVTHQSPGDTFWDIVRKGALAAAAKDNVQLVYSNDPDGDKQATLVQNAVDSKVDGIAVTLSHPDAMSGAVKSAVAKGVPVVALNAGQDNWKQMGVLEYFGEDEGYAGRIAGQRLSKDGAKHVLCVPQEQGSVSLEARCDGVAKGFSGTTTKLYVNGTSMPSVRTTISAKLKQDKSIDHIVMLGAPYALTAAKAIKDAGSNAKLDTFDMSPQAVKAIQSGEIEWAVDQQPYLQGYLAIDSLWLYKTNGNVIGGGANVATGPTFVDKSNVASVLKYATRGTR